MKKFLQILITVAIFAFVYHFRFEINQKLQPYTGNIGEKLGLTSGINPCIEPATYTLGTFDTKFGISKEYFLDAIAEAEAIWEKPAGKNLFDYVPEGSPRDLKVNLIYDYRQQATSKLSNIGIVVENNRASFESLKVKFDALKAEYEQAKQTFNIRVDAFNKKQQAYEKDVNYWNSRGGAPKEEFNKLEDRKEALQVESKKIQNLQNKINEQAEEINAMVVALNRLIASLNLSVEKFNSTNEARGESFEEGVYTSDGVNSEIDVYEFSNQDKLVRVLAHELGHALGLDHVDDPKAIMYELNQGNNMSLASSDIEELKSKCESKK